MAGHVSDAVVVGAGPAGLAAALALARAGASVTLVGPEPDRQDGRTAALMVPAITLLDGLGAWSALRPQAAPLRALTIVDDTDSLFRPPPATFGAAEIGLEALGWNIANADITAGLASIVRDMPTIRWCRGLAQGFAADHDVARITLDDGDEVLGRLVVAADGRHSRLREGAGLRAQVTPHPQSAFTTILAHERDHDGVSTEFHRRAGPFTLVPLPGRRASLVWVTTPRHAARLVAAPAQDVEAAVADASHGLLGGVRLDGPRGSFPLATVRVERLVSSRLALVGEAGHALPPIGAQGLNLGLADVQALGDAVARALREGRDIGSPSVLESYERARRRDLGMRAAAVGVLNGALLSPNLPTDAARGIGLGLLGHVGPLRRAAMRAGLLGRPAARPSDALRGRRASG